MSTISILGAGWLGQPLALRLKRLGHQVFASKTQQTGVDTLAESDLRGFVCLLPESNLSSDYKQLVHHLQTQQCDILIGSFPPGFRSGNGEEYALRWKYLTQAAKEANVQKIIMISSTTVYPATHTTMTEEDASLKLSQTAPHFSNSALIMLQAEQYVIDSGIEFDIVRYSGLIGPNRHPSRFASKLKQVSQAAPANMLHLEDAIDSVIFTLTHLSNQIVNATCPETVSKAEFYQAALNAVGSTEKLPNIVNTADKRISSKKLMDLGYQFHFNHTLDAL